MDSLGDEFLAGPRLPGNEYGGVGGGSDLDLFEYAAQRRTLPHDLREMDFAAWLDFTRPFFFNRLGLALLTLAPAVNRLPDGVEEVDVAEWFRQKFTDAGPLSG